MVHEPLGNDVLFALALVLDSTGVQDPTAEKALSHGLVRSRHAFEGPFAGYSIHGGRIAVPLRPGERLAA